MKNFKSFEKNLKEYLASEHNYKDVIISEPNVSHNAALDYGFSTDGFYDVYTFDGYGAFVINIGGDFKHISDLKKSYDEVLKCNPFHKILDMMNEGYEFCFGPAFPSKNGYVNDHLVGLYCKNYVEMAQKELSL